MTERSGFADVPGGRIWYRKIGDGTATPLLTVHGGPGHPHDGFEPLQQLAEHRPVIFYDQLGCGNSERPHDNSLWTVNRFVEELQCLREHLELERFILFGHSWGTALAVDYMLRYGGGVEKLVLMGPMLSTERWLTDANRLRDELPEDVKAVLDSHERDGTTDSAAYISASNVFEDRHVCRVTPRPASVQRSQDKMGIAVYNYMWGPSEFTCTGTLRDYDRVQDLHKLALPTLLLCGRYDEATPESAAHYCSEIDGARLHVFENASHSPHHEQPEEFIQIMNEFLCDD